MAVARPLTISRLAKLAGVGLETIRYYQRIGLIEKPARPEIGYRIYPQETLVRLHFILRGKELGFTLAEIRDLLSLEHTQCGKSRKIAQRKLEVIREKITDLQAMAAGLESLLEACEKNPELAECPIIEALSRHSRA